VHDVVQEISRSFNAFNQFVELLRTDTTAFLFNSGFSLGLGLPRVQFGSATMFTSLIIIQYPNATLG